VRGGTDSHGTGAPHRNGAAATLGGRHGGGAAAGGDGGRARALALDRALCALSRALSLDALVDALPPHVRALAVVPPRRGASPLALVPLHALPLLRGGGGLTPLCDRFTVRYAPPTLLAHHLAAPVM